MLLSITRLLAVALPALVAAAVLLRRERARLGRTRLGVVALLGAAAFGVAAVAEALVGAWVDAARYAPVGTDVMAVVFLFFVAAPLEQALQAAAVMPGWRRTLARTHVDGALLAIASGAGFALAEGVFLATRARSPADVAHLAIVGSGHAVLASFWGYALGRGARRRQGSGRFNTAWLVAAGGTGVLETLAASRGAFGFVASTPILAAGLVATWLLVRDLEARDATEAPRSLGPVRASSGPAPIQLVRAALERGDRPLMLHWVAYGALVTMGILVAMVAGAVALGRSLRVDFAAVDRGGSLEATLPPVALLAAAALAAFPIAGYLVARASGAKSVFEPALAAGAALVALLVLLGLAAPVAVVFALAFVPIAFGLACIGAYFALRG